MACRRLSLSIIKMSKIYRTPLHCYKISHTFDSISTTMVHATAIQTMVNLIILNDDQNLLNGITQYNSNRTFHVMDWNINWRHDSFVKKVPHIFNSLKNTDDLSLFINTNKTNMNTNAHNLMFLTHYKISTRIYTTLSYYTIQILWISIVTAV